MVQMGIKIGVGRYTDKTIGIINLYEHDLFDGNYEYSAEWICKPMGIKHNTQHYPQSQQAEIAVFEEIRKVINIQKSCLENDLQNISDFLELNAIHFQKGGKD